MGDLGFSGTSERSGDDELSTETRVTEVVPCQFWEAGYRADPPCP